MSIQKEASTVRQFTGMKFGHASDWIHNDESTYEVAGFKDIWNQLLEAVSSTLEIIHHMRTE